MIKLKKIKPMFNAILTTMDTYEDDVTCNSIIVKTKGTIKEYQKVVAVGDTVRSVKEGDLVCINPKRYAVVKHNEGSLKDGVVADNPVVKYNFDIIEMNNTPYLLLQDNDISYIIEDFEEIKDEKLIVPDTKLIGIG